MNTKFLIIKMIILRNQPYDYIVQSYNRRQMPMSILFYFVDNSLYSFHSVIGMIHE